MEAFYEALLPESTCPSCASERARSQRLQEALREIAGQDWVKNALDPQWAARIARAALKVSSDA